LNVRIFYHYLFNSKRILQEKRPTDCVTCAGAGTAKPSSQKNDKACENA